MSAPGLTSPIRSAGFDHLILNAGVFLANFDLDSIFTASDLKAAVNAAITAGTSLGMTNGGGTFTVKRTLRSATVDGRRYACKGDQFVDSVDPQITGVLVEATYQNLLNLIAGATSTASGNKRVVNMGTAIAKTDYLTNIVWVGDIADGQLIAIELYNALNTADFSWTFADKNEGQLQFEFHAHQTNANLYDIAPVRIIFFSGENLATTKTISNYLTDGAMVSVFSGSGSAALPAGNYNLIVRYTRLGSYPDDYDFTRLCYAVNMGTNVHPTAAMIDEIDDKNGVIVYPITAESAITHVHIGADADMGMNQRNLSFSVALIAV